VKRNVKWKPVVYMGLMTMTMFLALSAAARTEDAKKDAAIPAASASHNSQDDAVRFEGEKRFHSNCGRCHTAPPKFPPRMMATIIRHMRVRANITDEDRRLILRYMTQ
jgi:mono/diheme cytochrome c family protein